MLLLNSIGAVSGKQLQGQVHFLGGVVMSQADSQGSLLPQSQALHEDGRVVVSVPGEDLVLRQPGRQPLWRVRRPRD